MEKHEDYLGDGVYASIENGMLKLTADNGNGPSNTIYLEPEVIDALNRYVARVTKVRSSACSNG